MLCMKALALIVLGCLLSGAAETQTTQRHLVLSYVTYPQVELYVEFMSNIYRELGYSVKTIPTPSTRGLKLLSEGEVDADVIRLKQTALNYPNTIIVEPALKIGKVALLCSKNVKCDESVLQDKDVTILSADTIDFYLQDYHYAANIEKNLNVIDGIEMLKAKRANYAFVVLDGQLKLMTDFNILNIRDVSLFHVVNQKYAYLVPEIQQKLQENLPALQQKIETQISENNR
jgi:hypothetical protein